MSVAMDPNARIIPPDGFPLTVLVISCVLYGLSLITVGLRSYARYVKGIFGSDDTFMVAGLVGYTVATGLSIRSLLVGLGRLEENLNLWQWSESLKYYIIWILSYVLTLATVKSSICITILRIVSVQKPLRFTVCFLLAITWASFFITFIGTLFFCQPVSANWMPQLILSGKGKCAPVDTLIIIGHVSTVTTIATDLALVVVPAIILWNTQMKKQAKLQAFGLLSFASVASIITMVRIPYVNKYEAMKNLQFWVAHTMLCSNIETGIGCIASSIPSIRFFFRGGLHESTAPSSHKKSGGTRPNFFTVGSQPRERKGHDNNVNVEGGFRLSTVGNPHDQWERIHDGDSDLHSEAPIDPKGFRKERIQEESV